MAAIFEGIVGTLFLAILIAKLVGVYPPRRASGTHRRPAMKPSGDVTRLVFLVLFIFMLLAGSFWTLLPFLGGLIWAATVVIATWPLLLRLRARTGKRPWIAVAIMTGVILLAVILPFGFAVSTLLDVAHRGPEVLRRILQERARSSARVAWTRSRPSATSWRRSGRRSPPAAVKG